MKIWQILTRRLKKYVKVANFEREIESLNKYENLATNDKETEKV